MSHNRDIIIQVRVLPSAEAQAASSESQGELTAEVKFTPPHGMTDAQAGECVGRILKRLNKLADD